MGELKNIVFNPDTGLFEDSTDPTAHLTNGEVRKRRTRTVDPMAMQLKPVFRSIYLSGGERPLEGSTIELSWSTWKTQHVAVTFPSGNRVNFPPAGACQFVIPRQKSQVRIVAYNGKYSTRRTIQITPSKKTLITRLLEWINKNVNSNKY